MAQWSPYSALETGVKELSESDKLVLERYGAFRRSTMAGSSPQQQFDAAVQLIRGLPKDGPFQPSNDMKLRLYGFFKQATEGPCTQPAPSFWDVVGKAKWAAWKNLGDLPSEQAMTSYVDEIKQVMETMSLTDDVAHLMDTLGPVYEYVDDDGADGRSARKKHVHFSADEGAPTTNGHGAPAASEDGTEPAEEVGSAAALPNGSPPPRAERWAGSATSDTDTDDEFNDPIGEAEPALGRSLSTEARLDALHQQLTALARMVDSAGPRLHSRTTDGAALTNGVHPTSSAAAAVTASAPASSCPGVHDELRALVRDMRDDLDTVTGRLRRLEAGAGAEREQKSVPSRPWWQVPELSVASVLVLLAWPLVLQLVLRLVTSRRRR
ncbi:acyl-CoA-binding domain-containing protein 4-like isoform X2 [Amphibalanus amphitrite]|uniref:acyl-CoA-binding domain-containing protein 4-like isoform X2 n=1 Tax=Amphibalanus amphitrite TaxID=1232801 RepID=UPI001C921286|nr:acyl-CoA-binding domain-containing protein 4-like isoform X2 [Amphibalanus amphitrite]